MNYKPLSILLNVFLLTFTSFVLGQTVYRDYQDGLVVFQLKESVKIFPSDGKKVDFKQYPIFSSIEATGIQIEEVVRLHPELVNDDKLNRTYQIKVENPYKVHDVVRLMQQQEEVLYAELKDLHRLLLTPNDLGVNSSTGWSPTVNQWSLHKIKAQEAWDFSTGSASVKVAVTDDAFNIDHPDLVNKMLAGRDVVMQNNDPRPCGSTDGFHGTHVAGIVGAETDNDIGIASIGWNVSVIPVKIANCQGQLIGGYDGVIWAAQNGADIINMSWGGPSAGFYGQNIMNNAQSAGCILVAAAGNDGTDEELFPAAYPNVIAVASSNPNDAKSNFSQYGSFIDITAPGSFIRSTTHTNGYQNSQGTSMATPLVAGFLGLMKSFAPDATNEQLIQCLYDGADNIDSENPQFIGKLGVGRLNALNTMQCLQQYANEFDYDASIEKIIHPTGSFCGALFTPQVELKNLGQVPLTSVKINYSWGNVNATFNWTGYLNTGQSEVVDLPQQTVNSGSFTFTAFTSEPNNQQDENIFNDSASEPFSVDASEQPVVLNLDLDCYGSDISWEIRNVETNTIVREGEGYSDNSNGQTINDAFCLAAACYRFTINDSFGDGLNGSIYQDCSIDGSFEMRKGDGTLLFEMAAENGAFESSESHEFCLTPQSAALAKSTYNKKDVKLFPNPTSGQFTIEFESSEEVVSIEIMDISGRTVLAPQQFQLATNKSVNLNISEFQKGIYIVIIQSNGYEYMKRVNLR